MSATSSLIVPVGVEALCVGPQTDPERVRFVGATADFSDLPRWDEAAGLWSGRPYLGESITSFPRPTLQPGVHLHWALPDALTHGTPDAQGRLVFPPAPNRWLVVRLQAGAPPATAARAWVVESDYLDTDAGKASVSIPFRRSGSDQYFRFLGRALPLEQWREPATDAASFRAQTGAPLTAIGYGDAAFAAFYPNCRNVFGFHDRLEDLADPAAATTLGYLVAGWYSDPALDPAAPAPLAPSGNALGWSFTDLGAAGPRRTLCSGLVQDIRWAPDAEYFPDTSHPVEIAIGNTTVECVSALVANRPDLAGDADAEFILDAVQTGLLAEEWHHDQLARIAEALHTDGFASDPGGTSWQIRFRQAAAEGTSGAADLDPQLAAQLAAVNALQGAYDRAQWETDSLRQALYLDWYRFMRLLHGAEDRSIDASLPALAQPGARGDFLNAMRDFLQAGQDRLQELDAAKGGLVLPGDGGAAVTLAEGTAPAALAARLKDALAALAAALAAQRDGALVLQQTPGSRFWEPNEPVMLLSGADLEPPRRYGGDGTYAASGELPCRVTGEMLCALRLEAGGGAAAIGLAELLPALALDAIPCAAEIAALLAEAVLTDPAHADLIAPHLGTGSTVDDVRQWQAAVAAGETRTARLSASGRAPCRTGVTPWQANPWLPLFLEWEVQFQPTATPQDDSDAFAADAITSRYGFDADRIDLVHRGGPPARAQTLRGVTLLTQNAFTRLRESIGTLLATTPDPALQAIAGDLSARPVLAQVFNGFNQALLARKRAIQLEVFDPVSTKEQGLFTDLREAIGPFIDSAPLPLDPFHGIRAGFLRVAALTLIDAFGRVRPIDLSSARLARARSLLPADPVMQANGFIHLPPRLGQPARLNFRLLGADAAGAAGDAHAAASPVCGWVLVNNLDPGLAIYGADGTAFGTLRLVGGGAEAIWQPAPEAGAPIIEPGDHAGMRRMVQARIGNAHLADFVLAALDHPDRGRFLEALLHAVDRALETIVPDRTNPDPSLGLLIGRPLALVRASLSLELKGRPAFSTSWASLAHELDGPQDGGAPARNSRGFTGVGFEVKLGDLRQIDDGLVGYFIDRNGDGRDYLRFFSPAAAGTAGSVATPAADPVVLTAAPNAPALCVTLLMDPHAAVHATTGILPVKSVDIPPELFAVALSRLRVAFPCAPILAGAGNLRVPVPPLSGFAWNWLQAGQDGWIAGDGVTGSGERPPATYSPQRIVEGWLQLSLSPGSRAKT